MIGHSSLRVYLTFFFWGRIMSDGVLNAAKSWAPVGEGLECSNAVGVPLGACLSFRSGTLDIYSLSTASLVQSITAHHDAVCSFCLRPDSKGLLSCSKDRRVVVWDYALAVVCVSVQQHMLSAVIHQGL